MAVKTEKNPHKVFGMAPPQDETLQVRPRTYTLIVPVCALLATFGLFHFRHGPLKTRIISILTQIYTVVITMLNLVILIGATFCIGRGTGGQALTIEIVYCFLTLINFVNYCFMFYTCWRERRFASVLKALISIKQFFLEQGCSILTRFDIGMILLLSVFHIATITYFIVSFDSKATSTFLIEKVGIFQCTSDDTLRRILLGIQPFLWVSSSVLPCWLYVTLSYCTWMNIRTARRYLKDANKAHSMTEVTNTVEQVYDLVGAMDRCFKWYLLLMIGIFAALSFVSIVVLKKILWAIWLFFPVLIGLCAAFTVNYEVSELAEKVIGFWTCKTATAQDLMKISLIVTQFSKGWVGMTLCGMEVLTFSGCIAKVPMLGVTFLVGFKFIPAFSFNQTMTNTSDASAASAIIDSILN